MSTEAPFAFDPASPELPARLARHLAAAWREAVDVSAWRRFPAGMSWVTIGFTATTPRGSQELVLRVGDPGGLFAPYRTEPEFLALQALATVPDLPIPTVLLRCDDPAVLGAPFLVAGRVAGDTPTPWNGAATRDDAERRSLAHAFGVALGALHAFDWRATPLAAWSEGLGPTDVADREVRRWAAVAGAHEAPLPPALHHAVRWLRARAPGCDRSVVVHGDYRVGNFLRQGGRITAILDWELVHLGDPHEDLAWAGLRAFSSHADLVGGLASHSEFYATYEDRSGLAVDRGRLDYYIVFSHFKSAAMLLNASRRVQSGRTRDARLAAMGFQLAPTLMAMMKAMENAR